MDEATRKEKMFTAELLNQQLEHIQEKLESLDRQSIELDALHSALEQFLSVKAGVAMLVPLASGIFVPAQSVADKIVHVNVGNNVVVPKTVQEVQEMLAKQRKEMQSFGLQLQEQYDGFVERLQQFEKEMQEEILAQSKT